MSYTAYHLTTAGEVNGNITQDQMKSIYGSGEGLLWIDMLQMTKEDGQFLEDTFDFHPLAIEDCLNENLHPPKIDDFGDYLFIIIHGVNYAVESELVGTAELTIFLGKNYVITTHRFPLLSIEAVKERVDRDGRPMQNGAELLSYSIIDTLVDNVLPTVDKMTEIAESIEEEIIRQPQQATLEAILKLKRSAIQLHRIMTPQREVLNRMSRGDFKFIGEDARIYYRDIYDHIVRLDDLNQTVRDMADNALATYLSSIANKQNEVMKILSIVAAIFLPLGLITGIFGMNFKYMPELNLPWGYYSVLGFIGFVILVVIGLFWVKGLIHWGRKRITRVIISADKSKLSGRFGNIRRKH
ncbi:magnesium/cobalt transporter CorA [Chloroflexota bacterium]